MFNQARGIIVPCDVPSLKEVTALVEALRENSWIVGYKVGFSLALRYGLKQAVVAVKKHTECPVIYDHQKAGTDIPQMGAPFAECCADAGVDGVIIFPHAGPETLTSFVKEVQSHGMVPIVGAHMSHPSFLASDDGFIVDDAPQRIHTIGRELEVEHFVMPATQLNSTRRYAQHLMSMAGPVAILMPGIGRQGADLPDAFAAAQPHRTYAIIGSAIYASDDPRGAADGFAQQILAFEERER